MNHGKKFNHLKRKSSQRKALLSNLAKSLILKKRICTTTAKAKALRVFVEPLLTKSKTNTTHSRRTVFSHFQDKHTIKELFDIIAVKIENRPGGYTRIIKLSDTRRGDNAEKAIIELVDFNEVAIKKQINKIKTRRTRKKNKSISTNKNIENTKSSDLQRETSPKSQKNTLIEKNEQSIEKTDKEENKISYELNKKEQIEKIQNDNTELRDKETKIEENIRQENIKEEKNNTNK